LREGKGPQKPFWRPRPLSRRRKILRREPATSFVVDDLGRRGAAHKGMSKKHRRKSGLREGSAVTKEGTRPLQESARRGPRVHRATARLFRKGSGNKKRQNPPHADPVLMVRGFLMIPLTVENEGPFKRSLCRKDQFGRRGDVRLRRWRALWRKVFVSGRTPSEKKSTEAVPRQEAEKYGSPRLRRWAKEKVSEKNMGFHGQCAEEKNRPRQEERVGLCSGGRRRPSCIEKKKVEREHKGY